jgi:chromosome segregation ATPase
LARVVCNSPLCVISEANRQQNDTVEAEQRSMQTNIHLESEVERLTAQVEELKAAFTKTRDLLRAEQTTLENMKSSGRRMHEELEAAREDVVRMRTEAEEDALRHKAQIKSLTTNMEDLEEKRIEEVKDLRHEISKSYSEMAASQKQSLELTELLDKEKYPHVEVFDAGMEYNL